MALDPHCLTEEGEGEGEEEGDGEGERKGEREKEREREVFLKSVPSQLRLSEQLSHRQSGSSVGRHTVHANSWVPAGAEDS